MLVEGKHTPLPWSIDDTDDCGHILGALDRFCTSAIIGCIDLDSPDAEDNASLIVTAVNSHHDLLEALREAHETMHECTAVLSASDCAKVAAVMVRMRAAIAKSTLPDKESN